MALWSRLTGAFSSGHLRDDDLLHLLVPAGSEPAATRARAHLDQCGVCAKRSAQLKAFLNGIEQANEATLARAFPLNRLATQRERIMRRLRRSVEPARRGRVLSFPALARPTFDTVHRAHRWLVGAAAAGLLFGLAAGQFLHVHPAPRTATARTAVETAAIASPDALEQPSAASIEPTPAYDDPFLDELEVALSSPQVPELSPLDEITPRVREVAVNLW